MQSGAIKVLDVALYRRGQSIAALARALSVSLGLLALVLVWDDPRTRPGAALAVLGAYAVLVVAGTLWNLRYGRSRGFKIVQDVADALAIGLGAAFTGGTDSPVWLLLYPHVVAVSVRGGLAYALAMGALDATILALLMLQTPGPPLGMLHALALLFCAFMAGTTSSYLNAIQDSLAEVNRELSVKNTQLSQSISAHEASRRAQEKSLGLLQASETRYRLLLERIQDGVLIVQDGRVAYANEVFGAMAGETPEALVGADFRDLLPPEDRERIGEEYRRWESSHAVSGVLETRLRTRQGSTLLVGLRAGSMEFEGRRSMIATIRDITGQRRMEEEVKAHSERLAAINEIANAVNLSLTVEGILGVVAEEARRLLPFDRLTIALRGERDAVEVVAVGPGILRQDAPFRGEEVSWAWERPHAWCEGHGEVLPAHGRDLMSAGDVRAFATVPLFSEDRAIGSLNLARREAIPFTPADLAIMEPVARHIAISVANARLLEAVRRRGHEFESLLEIGRRIVERLDVSELLPLVTRSVNRVMLTRHCVLSLLNGDTLELAAQEGLEPDVVEAFRNLKVGHSLTGWVVQHGRPLAVADMREDPRLLFGDMVRKYGYRSFLAVPLRRGAETLGTLEVITKDEVRVFGPEDQALMTAFADQAAVAIENARLFEDARRHLATVVEANQQLEELDRGRRQYLRNISHEFRTPLTVIRGYAEFLLDSEPQHPNALRDVMRIIMESSDRVIDLVDTLLDVSRIEQEGAERNLHFQPVDLKDLARSCVEPLRAAAEKKDVRLLLDCAPEEMVLEGDRGLLRQVVRKLVDNAIKYSPAGQAVVVRVRSEDEELSLEVQDRGIGIPEEAMPHIFEKFYMVDGGMTRRAGGAGVGLYLVREIVRLHNGRLSVDSQPGRGSVFSVRLPRGPAARPQAVRVS